ncbi:MAG: UDP-2,3-diacylglucosamine diphosphatase [Methylococcales bacterium]|nr:UDP-2,3-diacylglucosamine diphosphatase [Methylococcales bacterium]
MEKETIFISDLHISLNKKEITKKFLLFLENQARQANAIYILGDLFDAWIGDDDNTPPNKQIKTQLKLLTDSGVSVFLQQGNRDFLIGDQFCTETGITLLDDYAVIKLNGVNTLLTHGDLLCTDDLPYQAFREKSRTEEWKQNVLSKPLLIRLLAARWYRFRSFFHKRKKSQDIMDVNQQTVIDEMKKHDCYRLIHGHTHRPFIHNLEIKGKPALRFVLAEWKKDSVEILRWNAKGYKIENI